MPGSGKSLLADILKSKGFVVITMSEALKKRYEREARIGERLMDFAKRMREIYGEGIVARLSMEEVPAGANKIAFDGVRSLYEVEEFKRLGEPVVIAVHSPPALRYQRLLARKRPEDPKDVEGLRMRDKDELKFGIGEVIAMADYIIVNDGTIDEFKKRAEEVLSRILK